MSAENWHEERDRLVLLLDGIACGTVTHVDQENLAELQVTSPKNLRMLQDRLAELNSRLGETKA